MLLSVETVQQRMIGRDLEGRGKDYSRYHPEILHRGTEENHDTVRIAGISAKIRTEYFPVQIYSGTSRPVCWVIPGKRNCVVYTVAREDCRIC
jgi:hypothetical protein